MNFAKSKTILDPMLISTLTQLFDRKNELVKIFRKVRDRFTEDDYLPFSLLLVANRETDGRDTNIPTHSYEFAALVPEDDFVNARDIVVDYRNGLKRICTLHPSFMALQYPDLFPYGENGYRLNILHRGIAFAMLDKRNTVTMREYYAYRLQYRTMEGHSLIKGGRLFL